MKKLQIIDYVVLENGYQPEWSRENAGIDIFIPKNFETKTLEHGDTVIIPCQLKFNLPYDICLIAFNKSGIATKYGLQVGACVIDSSYIGECNIHLTKVTKGTCELKAGMKIVQFVPFNQHLASDIILVKTNEITKETKRGEGKFGSTGEYHS